MKFPLSIRLWINYVQHIHLNKARIRWLRIILGGVAVIVSIGLMYIYAWQTLHQDISLPPGVSAQDPTLNTIILQQLNKDRSDRVNKASHSFDSVGALFK